MLDRAQIRRVVIESLQDEGVCLQADGKLDQVPLLGDGAIVKSVGLVAVLVGVEERLADRYSLDISLMDDRAMSQSRSPFRNVQALVDYIDQLVIQARP